MEFDIRTPDLAFNFLLNFLQMEEKDYVFDFVLGCGRNPDRLWNRYIKIIDSVDITNLKVIAFHITSTLDSCNEIKEKGLINLQKVLTTDTIFSDLLSDFGFSFNLQDKTMFVDGNQVDIDYDHHRGKSGLNKYKKSIEFLSRRIFFEFEIEGFLCLDRKYGTNIHLRPEFILNLVNCYPSKKPLEVFWIEKSKSYKISFFTFFSQIDPSTYYSEEYNHLNLTNEQIIKKWMLTQTINRIENNSSEEEFLYCKKEVSIPPDQIISYEEIPHI